MLNNLKTTLKQKNIKYDQIAQLLGTERTATVSDKITGKSKFTSNEALKIRNVLCPEYDFNWLFEETNQNE